MKIGGAQSLAVLALTALVAGCGGGGGGSSSSAAGAGSTGGSGSEIAAVKADPAIAKQVPAKIKSAGTLTAAQDPTYAPNEFIAPDGKTIVGMDPDLIKAIGAVMGLKVRPENVTFNAIIPGLAAHKYDVGVSSFTDTKEREKTLNFVTYYNAGTSFYGKKGGPVVTSLSGLCNKTVAVEQGTTQQGFAEAQGKKCPVKVLTFPDQNGANLAISSGRAQVGMADSPVAEYQVKKSNGQFQLNGKPFGLAPYGIAIPKDVALQRPIRDALVALMKDGTYMKILEKWGVQQGAIKNPTINGAQS
jgi:polar amino acid transport system substrate-binding protein